MRCGIELMFLMAFMFEEYFLLFCMWNAFPVKQCSIEETLTKPFLFWIGFGMFLNLMNLDTKLVVASLGQDSAFVVALLFFDPPCLNLEVRLFIFYIIIRIYYDFSWHHYEENSEPSFRRSSATYLEASIGAYTLPALSPIQFQALLDRRPILPDPYSSRFGVRTDPLKVIERAHYFTNWSAPCAEPPPRTEIKKFMLCTVHFTPIGVLTLQQAGILVPGDGCDAARAGYFRHHAPMYDQLSGEFQRSYDALL